VLRKEQKGLHPWQVGHPFWVNAAISSSLVWTRFHRDAPPSARTRFCLCICFLRRRLPKSGRGAGDRQTRFSRVLRIDRCDVGAWRPFDVRRAYKLRPWPNPKELILLRALMAHANKANVAWTGVWQHMTRHRESPQEISILGWKCPHGNSVAASKQKCLVFE
jgi:hypothetical protein